MLCHKLRIRATWSRDPYRWKYDIEAPSSRFYVRPLLPVDNVTFRERTTLLSLFIPIIATFLLVVITLTISNHSHY